MPNAFKYSLSKLNPSHSVTVPIFLEFEVPKQI